MKKSSRLEKSLKRFFIKMIIVFTLFLVVFISSLFTKLPEYFDTYVIYENYQFKAHIWLIIYRIIMYFVFPILISVIELIKFKDDKLKYSKLVIENFNVQFCTYAIIASLYAIFGIDKILGVDIFGNADTFLFITGFISTTIINRGIPDLLQS